MLSVAPQMATRQTEDFVQKNSILINYIYIYTYIYTTNWFEWHIFYVQVQLHCKIHPTNILNLLSNTLMHAPLKLVKSTIACFYHPGDCLLTHTQIQMYTYIISRTYTKTHITKACFHRHLSYLTLICDVSFYRFKSLFNHLLLRI